MKNSIFKNYNEIKSTATGVFILIVLSIFLFKKIITLKEFLIALPTVGLFLHINDKAFSSLNDLTSATDVKEGEEKDS